MRPPASPTAASLGLTDGHGLSVTCGPAVAHGSVGRVEQGAGCRGRSMDGIEGERRVSGRCDMAGVEQGKLGFPMPMDAQTIRRVDAANMAWAAAGSGGEGPLSVGGTQETAQKGLLGAVHGVHGSLRSHESIRPNEAAYLTGSSRLPLPLASMDQVRSAMSAEGIALISLHLQRAQCIPAHGIESRSIASVALGLINISAWCTVQSRHARSAATAGPVNSQYPPVHFCINQLASCNSLCFLAGPGRGSGGS